MEQIIQFVDYGILRVCLLLGLELWAELTSLGINFPKPFVNMNLESRHAYLEKDRDRNQKCHQNAHTSVIEDKQLVGFKFGLLKVFKIIHQWLSGMFCVAHRWYQFKQFCFFLFSLSSYHETYCDITITKGLHNRCAYTELCFSEPDEPISLYWGT